MTSLRAGTAEMVMGGRPYSLTEQGLQDFAASGAIVRLTVPERPLQMLALIRGIFLTGIPDYEPKDFPGGSIVLTEFNLWDESADGIGWRYYEGVLRRHGIDGSISKMPAVTVDGGRDAWLSICAVGLLAPMFVWDGWLLSARDLFLGFVSHHSYVDIALPTEFDAARFRKEMPGQGAVLSPR